MMKKILLLFTVLLLTAGGGQLWADTTHELILNSGATEKTNGGNAVEVPQGEQSTCYFKIIDTSESGAYNYNAKYYGYYGGVHYTNGLKIQSNTKLYFTTSSIATVTIVQATKANDSDNNKGIKFGISGNTTSYAYTDAVTPSEVSETTERVRVYTFANQAAGSYAIEQNGGESGLFYVRVVESGKNAPSFSFADHSNVNMRIAYNESNGTYTRTISTNTSNGTVTYSINDNPAGATINSSTGQVTATAAGTYVIHAAVSETESYTAASDEYNLIVTKGSSTFSGPDTYTQSYPYTWDFSTSGSQWATSQTQMTSTYGDWGGDGTYYHQSYPDAYSTYPIGFNIAVIKGLRFSHNYLGLDWGYGHIWYAGGGSITIPGLVTGQTVTFLMDGRGDGATTVTAPNTSESSYSVSSTGTHQEYTYTVTSSGDIVFTFDKNISIRSIAVSADPTRNTFVWNFAKPISAIDQKLLNGTNTEWVLESNNWNHGGTTPANNGPFAQNGKELEHVYGLKAKIPNSDSNTLIYTNSGGLRLNTGGDNRYLCIPSLKAGDKVTVLCNNYSKDRGINLPDNIVNNSTAKGWGEYSSTGEFTCEGYVEADGNVLLKPTSALDIKTITVESSNKPWPTTLSFAKCAASATVNVKIPYGASTATYTNTLVAPEGRGAVSYDVLLGNATVDANGVVTINAAGEVIVRATTAGGDNYSAYYCDYIINATESDFTLYNSSASTYEWRFSDASWWVTTDDILTESAYWSGNSDQWYSNEAINGTVATLHTSSASAILPEANNLTFTNSNSNKRVGVKVGEYLWVNASTVTLPSLSAGSKVTIYAKSHQNSSATMTATNAVDENNASIGTMSFTSQTQVSTNSFFVQSTGTVAITVSGIADIMLIKVEKPELTFSEHHTQYYDGSGNITSKYIPYFSTPREVSVRVNITNGASVEKGDFEVESSDNKIINANSWGYSDTEKGHGEIWFNNLLTSTKAGTAVLTFRFKGNATYAAKSFSITLTVTKSDPMFTFTYYDKNLQTEDYTTGMITKGMNLPTGVTLATDAESSSAQKAHGITFASSNTDVATVNQYTGKITFVKPGITVITANFAGNDVYNAAKTYFSLLINGNTAQSGTLSWDVTSNTPTTPTNGVTRTISDNSIAYPASFTGSGTVKYMSSDTEIATVNSSGEVVTKDKHPGTVHIYAYVNGSVDGETYYNCHYLDYELTVNGGDITINFEPTSGTVTTGYVLMPRLIIPSIEKGNISTLSLTSSNPSVASVPDNLLDNEYLSLAGTRIEAVYPKITGVAPGTATITASFKSPYYNNGAEFTADFYVTVTNNTGNFSWATTKTEFTIVEGEFMMMPSITGNANGNIDGLSKGSVNQARQGYVYEIKGSNRSITYNTEDYYYGQGVPDYTLTPAAVNGGEAYIYWIKGMDDSHPALMIYGESAGDLTLTATDSQTGYSPGNITIHVVSKDERVKANETTFWNSNKFPFTWDFTNIAPADITDDEVHWKTKYYGTVSSNAMDLVTDATSGCHLLGMASSFDYNYSDEQDTDNLIAKNKSGKDPQAIAKYICNGEGSDCKVMPAFHGIRIALGNNSQGRFHHKRDKVRLFDTSTNDPRLYIEGGPHYLYLPAVGFSKTPGTAYKLFMKVKGHTYKEGDKGNSSHVDVHVLSDDKGDPSTTTIASEYVITKDVKSVIGFDIPAEHAGKAVRLGFDKNVDIYWIAYSTEEKTFNYPKKSNSNLSYAAAAFSYPEDLDLTKSKEVNGATAYYASSFTTDNDASAGSTDGNETQYAVLMKPLKNLGTYVKAGTGMILKYDDLDDYDGSANVKIPYYMIANPRNVATYNAPENITGEVKNYLVGTGGSEVPDVPGRGTEIVGGEEVPFTNFVMSSSYYYYTNINDLSTVQGGKHYDRDWSFYPVMSTGTVAAQKSYLHIPANVYVTKDGKIVDMPTSARAAFDVESAADDTAEAPATKAALSIVFDDSVPATPEDPATEEPEDGDSDKDKDRPRKPGDDGWPKPPFPPIIITDIDNVKTNEADNAVWHSMEGVRISQPTKPGLYIRNGKKVVIK